ncbi:MAG: tyrosine-type recombinase/integrase [Rhodothermales bacterium]|nr:tyrosine-type recombinase/integrase [Rhodothermales bacterium]
MDLADLTSDDVNLLPAYLHRFDREQTRRAYRSDLIQFFGTDFINARLVRRASFLHVNEHIAHLETEGARPSTIKRRVAAIRGFFEWLEAVEVIEKNPAHRKLIRKVRSTGSRDRHIVFLSRDQADLLLDATHEAGEAAIRDYALIKTLLYCVLRRSEAAAMDFEHIRPLGKYWILDLPSTKGGADQYVKIPDHLVDDIDAVRNHYGYDSGAVWRSLSNNARGKRLSTNAIYELVRRTAARAALPMDVGAHTLRHTGCTLAIEAGASLQQVKDHARHKHVETTMVYIHQQDRLKDSAADYIETTK